MPLTVKRISKRVVSSVSSFFNAKPCAAMLRAQSVRQQNNVSVFRFHIVLDPRLSLRYAITLCHLMPLRIVRCDRSMLSNSSIQGEEVFAKHNKFGLFPIPRNFLNQNGPPDTLDTSALDLKTPSSVTVESKEAADKAAEEAAKEKKVAKDEAKKARRERAKAAAAVAAKEKEEEATAIAMEYADSTKASKAGSPVQIRPRRSCSWQRLWASWMARAAALHTRWLPQVATVLPRGDATALCIRASQRPRPGFLETTLPFSLTTRCGAAPSRASAPSSSLASPLSLVPSTPRPRPLDCASWRGTSTPPCP